MRGRVRVCVSVALCVGLGVGVGVCVVRHGAMVWPALAPRPSQRSDTCTDPRKVAGRATEMACACASSAPVMAGWKWRVRVCGQRGQRRQRQNHHESSKETGAVPSTRVLTALHHSHTRGRPASVCGPTAERRAGWLAITWLPPGRRLKARGGLGVPRVSPPPPSLRRLRLSVRYALRSLCSALYALRSTLYAYRVHHQHPRLHAYTQASTLTLTLSRHTAHCTPGESGDTPVRTHTRTATHVKGTHARPHSAHTCTPPSHAHTHTCIRTHAYTPAYPILPLASLPRPSFLSLFPYSAITHSLTQVSTVASVRTAPPIAYPSAPTPGETRHDTTRRVAVHEARASSLVDVHRQCPSCVLSVVV